MILLLTPINEGQIHNEISSFGSVLAILKDRTILLLFLGIVFVVGVDVGMNTAAPKLLMERCFIDSIQAGYGPSVYFALRTLGALIGAIILSRFPSNKFFRINIVVTVLALGILFFAYNATSIFVLYGIIGFTIANIFSILYSMALKACPEKGNEISGLMITGVFGGAVFPFLMGILSDVLGSQIGGVIVILAGTLYLTFASFAIKINN